VKRRRRAAIPGAASAIAFNRLGMQWLEMMAASQAVILHRLSRSNTPAQVIEMSTEKWEAALLASRAMSRYLLAAPPTSMPAAMNAWARIVTSGMQPFHARAVRNARGFGRLN
jgi:hypothetical protein